MAPDYYNGGKTVNHYCCNRIYAFCSYIPHMYELKDRVIEALGGVSQNRMAKVSGISQQALSKLTKGNTTDPGINTIKKLAEATGYSFNWLAFGIAPKTEGSLPTIPVVGFVGAGAEIYPFDDHAKGAGLDEIPAPAWIGDPAVAVEVRGDSMLPLRDGWRLIYSRHDNVVSESKTLNKLCVCKVDDGRTFVKELRKGSRRGLYRLVSWSLHSSDIDDVKLEWAAPVLEIRTE